MRIPGAGLEQAAPGSRREPRKGAKAAPLHTRLSATFGQPAGGSPQQPPRTPRAWPRRGRSPPALRPPPRGVSAGRRGHLPAPHPQRLDRHTDTRPWSAPLTYLQPRFLLETPSDRPPPVGGELQPHRPGIAGTRPAPRQRPGAWSGAALGSAPLGSAGLGQAAVRRGPGLPPPLWEYTRNPAKRY